MDYKVEEFDSYNIHFIKTKKFKTIDVRIMFIDDFKKEDITKRNALFDNLLYSSKKYPTKRSLNIKCQDLYSAYVGASSLRLGNYLISKIGISFLNPKYTENAMFEESLDLLKEIIFNPNVLDGEFDKENFAIVKKDLLNEAKSVKEQPRVYAVSKMLENMSESLPYRYHGYSYKEDIDNLDEKKLYEYYQQFIKSNHIEIFVVGDFDSDMMKKLIRKKFVFDVKKKAIKNVFIQHDKVRRRAKKSIEESENIQSNLVVGLKLKGLKEFERKYVINIYSLLLGGFTDSLLMQNIREDNSMVYYINAYLNKVDNLIIIKSGLAFKNFEKVIKLIRTTMKQIENGDFDENSILKYQLEYNTSIDYALSMPGSVMDFALMQYLGLSDPIDTRKKEIMKVTKRDIQEVNKRVFLDTIYLLRGE